MTYEEYLKKKRKKKILKCLKSFFLSINILINIECVDRLFGYNLVNSPYDGNRIDISDYELNKNLIKITGVLDDQLSYDEIKKKIENNMTIDEKKNSLLLYALYENKTFDEQDIKNIAGYINYLNDNKYINYELTYKILRSSKLIKNVNLGNDLSGVYLDTLNIITISDDNALGHELFHNEDIYIWKNRLSAKSIYLWFVEGFAEVLNQEYMDSNSNSYPVFCSAIRIFTEMIGKDNMLKIRTTGEFNILLEFFKEKNIDENNLIILFDDLDKCLLMNKKNENTDELRLKICAEFINLYNDLYNYPEYINPTFIQNLNNIESDYSNKLNTFKYYLFNSEKISYYKKPQKDLIMTDDLNCNINCKVIYNDKFISFVDENKKEINRVYYTQDSLNKYIMKTNNYSKK